MSFDADNLQRLRVARKIGYFPPDLADWVFELVEDSLHTRRGALRNDRLQRAAALLEGSKWARVRQLERLAVLVDEWGLGNKLPEPPGTALGFVMEALAIAPLPCRRQLLRIIKV